MVKTSDEVKKLLRNIINSPVESYSRTQVVLYVVSKGLVTTAGEYLAGLVDVAYRLRNWPRVGDLADLLSRLPHEKYLKMGQLYRGLYLRHVQGPLSHEGRAYIHSVIEQGPAHLRARALLAMGGLHLDAGDAQTARDIYAEAASVARDSADHVTLLSATKMLGVVDSVTGDPKRALEAYDAIHTGVVSISRYRPELYLDLLNSYAVDLADIGRLDEAERLASYVASSSYSQVFTEWRGTLDKIRHGRRQRPARYKKIARREGLESMYNEMLAWMVLVDPLNASDGAAARIRAMHLAFREADYEQ